MIHVNLITNKRDAETFCDCMDRLLKCRRRHCHLSCWAQALRDVQTRCDKGETIAAGCKKWAETGIAHKVGEEILADILGVIDMDALRAALRLPGETS